MAISSTNTQVSTSGGGDAGSSTRMAFSVITMLFFMWGFLTCLNDILIPHLKNVFDLNYTKSMLIQFTFFTAYFVMSIPSGTIIEKVGYKKGIIYGLSTSGVGALLFYPAAEFISYPLFLGALFILASGITMLQVAANPYVSVLGAPETASSRLNLSQAFNSLGTTLAPFLGGMIILQDKVVELGEQSAAQIEAAKLAEAQAVQIPYIGLALALFVLAFIIYMFKLPKIQGEGDESHGTFAMALKYPHVALGVIGIFVYVGAEVSIGSFLVNYLKNLDLGNIATEKDASKFVSFYWGGAMVGRFIGSAVLQKVRPGTVLGVVGVVASILLVTSILTTGFLSMWSVILIGLFNSVMFPTIFTLAIDRMGPLTSKASSLLVMAIVGGAIIPLAQGALADTFTLSTGSELQGLKYAFFLPLICYAFIAFYGFVWEKIKRPYEQEAA